MDYRKLFLLRNSLLKTSCFVHFPPQTNKKTPKNEAFRRYISKDIDLNHSLQFCEPHPLSHIPYQRTSHSCENLHNHFACKRLFLLLKFPTPKLPFFLHVHHQIPFDQITLIPSHHSFTQKIYHQTFNPLIKDVYTPPIYLGLNVRFFFGGGVVLGGKSNCWVLLLYEV